MKVVFSPSFTVHKEKVLHTLNSFEKKGVQLGNGDRNKIKWFQCENGKINIKSFKVPNFINKIAYRYFRKSKAHRSFEYAQILISKKIGTPQPVAYAEVNSSFFFTKSYFISEHQDCDLTFRELEQGKGIPNWEEMIRAFTRFTFDLHEKEIEFLDHSPGNTLIRIENGNYQFFLVDLNRMNFGKLSFDKRMENFSRLTSRKEIVKIMANEYSKYYHRPESEIFGKMWKYTSYFQKNFRRKHRMKQKIKFWKA